MDDPLGRLKAANAAIEERDAELREELRERRDSARLTEEGTGQAEVLVAGAPTSRTELAQETIVRRTGRPVLAIVRNEVVIPDDSEGRVWRARLLAASNHLTQAIRAVGRIEVEGHALSWLGTGWLVEPDVIVTNRHVAGAFARRSGTDFIFRQGVSSVPMSASIDFLEEIGRTESFVFRVEKVLHIEDDDGPDLAFLRVAPAAGQALSAPIALAGRAPLPEEAVAVIGYPARDSRIPDVELMDRIFGNVYDKKRLAPGQVMRVDRGRLQHDCSTLGGNSGSAVVSLSSGEALGIHFAGTFLTANAAVPSALIAERQAAIHRPSPGRPSAPSTQLEKEDAARVAAHAVATLPVPAATLSFNLPVSVTVQIGQPAIAQSAKTPRIASTEPTADVVKGHAGDRGAGVRLADVAEAISWPADIFSVALDEAVTLHDYNRAEALVATFARLANGHPYPHAARHANRDLDTLRRKRQFTLMRRYAEAALRSGTSDARVRRQYGQALIELGAFEAARRVLQPVVRDGPANPGEAAEAQGLIGRSYKQQYVDAPAAEGADERLRQAVAAYRAVYDRDATRLWHGINAASCTLRGVRDGRTWADESHARAVAQAVLDQLARGNEKAPDRPYQLDVWDHATRVEALLVLGRHADAEQALDAYLAHPGLDAFEVTSTHRQLTQVLQLDDGNPVVRRLWEEVKRYRAGGTTWRATDAGSEAAPAGQAPPSPHGQRGTMSVLVRVSDPAWKPANVPGVQVRGRLGTVIAAEASRASLPALLRDPSVVSVESSRAVASGECDVSVPFIQALGQYTGPAGSYHERGDRALIAIIDNGIDALHEAFLDEAGESRIVGIWDQRPAATPGTPPEGFDFGTFHGPEDIARYVRDKVVPPQLGRDAKGHGTHVASIAAGRKAGQFSGGVAPEALLLVVISDTRDPIGYSTTHVAALDFIDRMATKLGLPVVVNVSQGMNAGAHDGKSALEVAFDEFSKGGRRPGRVIVKSAGNERHKNGHAVVTVAEGPQEHLTWKRPSGTTWPRERLELWWSSANELEFRLVNPRKQRSEWVTEARPMVDAAFPSGNPYRIDLVKRHIDNGDSQLLIDIGEGVDAGEWRLEIKGRRVPDEGTIHAWLERIDDLPSAFTNHASEETTISIPGTAQTVVTVGAVGLDPLEVGHFSSYGPTRDRRQKPDVVAPGVAIKAACGNSTSDIIAMDGTSMAAPHVAGAIALVLSRAMKSGNLPTATQIASALRQKTSNYTSRWDRGQGYGIVDAAKLLAAF